MSERRFIAAALWVLLSAASPAAAQAAPTKTPPVLLALQDRVQSVVAVAVPATVGIEVGRARGSGAIVSADGLILTAAHVFEEPGRPARVILHDGRVLRGITLGKQDRADYGMLRILGDRTDWPHVAIGDSDAIERGQLCLATGHPGGVLEERPPVVRLGLVTGTRGPFLRTSCVINSGDSGGPLFDLTGKLIGIHSRIRTRETQNYHVPVSRAVRNWERLVAGERWDDGEGEYPAGPWLGVRVRSAEGRVEIERIEQGGPASGSALRVGDVLHAFDGAPIADVDALLEQIRGRSPNESVTLRVLRDGKELDVKIVLGVKP